MRASFPVQEVTLDASWSDCAWNWSSSASSECTKKRSMVGDQALKIAYCECDIGAGEYGKDVTVQSWSDGRDVVDHERVFARASSTGIGRTILHDTVPLSPR